MQAWLAFGNGLRASGLEDSLTEPVRVRARQIDGWNRVQIGLRAVHPVGEREAV
jgi:hypothetical protein